MIEAQIAELVKAHYARENAEILLLSKLGEQLIKDGAWPLDRADKRTLYEVARAAPGVSIVSDPALKAFFALVEKGDEARAVAEIERRKKLFFLRGLPAALLRAFTVEVTSGAAMYVILSPRPQYRTGQPDDSTNFELVDDDLRLPGLDSSDLDAMQDSDRQRLEANIREWAQRHNIDLSALGQRKKPAPMAPASSGQSQTALDRLYAAQLPEIARQIIIPIDIAIALTRLS